MPSPILEVKDLRVTYHTPQRVIRAVDGVSLSIVQGERFGLVGESGSGKSTIAMAILRLIKPPGRIESGEIVLYPGDGEGARNGGRRFDLLTLPEEQMRRLRLASIALIGQGAMNSLNPVARIRVQILDGLRDHGVRLSRREQKMRVGELLESVGLSPRVADMYPHELSGGMKQRVVIAIAISLRPRLIIADEPTSALDVIVQRQVIETLCQIQENLHASVLMVGHDMGLMAQSVHRLGVMYGGRLVEVGSVKDIFHHPQHSYTQMLIRSLPSLTTKEPWAMTKGERP